MPVIRCGASKAIHQLECTLPRGHAGLHCNQPNRTWAPLYQMAPGEAVWWGPEIEMQRLQPPTRREMEDSVDLFSKAAYRWRECLMADDVYRALRDSLIRLATREKP